jgi:hypothetical protein
VSRVSPRNAFRLIIPALLVAAVVPASARPATAVTSQARLQSPKLAAVVRAGAGIRDTTLSAAASRSLAATADWGGTFTASTGERVNIRVSDSYPQDPAVAQRWADFLASLIHGPEISTVDVYLAPLSEVQRFCGRNALACYSAITRRLIAPGDDPDASISAEAVVTHEYGHHVAASRDDSPWPAVEYGTKRWSTYEHVCTATRAGLLFPGAEDADRYELNPGEAFAESYRVLNQRHLGMPETQWDIVTESLYPDDTALSLLQQDVLSPWTANTSVSSTTSLTRSGRVKTVTVATPLDGTLRVTAHAVRGERVRVVLLSASGARSQSTTLAGAASRSISGTVCGVRNARIRLTLTRGSGRVTLTTSRP